MQNILKIQNLSVTIAGKTVVKDINLSLLSGEVHVIMGPNGSGKSSLALALAGHPDYKVVNGKVLLGGYDLLRLTPDERAKMGLFLSFQNPVAIPGVTLGQLILSSYKSINKEKVLDIGKFHTLLESKAKILGLKSSMLERFINDGFSGGEKKKAEMLTLLCIPPKFAILDEIDSGLDIDTLKIIAEAISCLAKEGTGIILITHNPRSLKFIKPDFVHILKAGKIVKTGNHKLAREVEYKGYAKI